MAKAKEEINADVLGKPVKAFHMSVGVDLIGSKTSMAASTNLSLITTAIGVKVQSKGSARTIVIPYANIKGLELFE